MTALSKFFKNPFSSEKISLANKKKFGEDHCNRITVQNTSSLFDTLLANTLDAQDNLFGGIAGVETSAAVQQARTQTVDGVMAAFSSRNSRFNNFLKANGTDKLPVYQEFFPLGVGYFTSGISKANVQQRMVEMKAAIAANLAVAGGEPVLAEYQDLLDTYVAARNNQLGKMGEVSDRIDSRNALEAVWDDQMFSNLLEFAQLYRNQPEKLKLFMNETILLTPTKSATDGKGMLAGTVTTNPGNLPTQGVLVHVIDGNINDATTAADGSYSSQQLPIGNYQVVYSKEGYVSKTVSVTVMDDGDSYCNVLLEEA